MIHRISSYAFLFSVCLAALAGACSSSSNSSDSSTGGTGTGGSSAQGGSSSSGSACDQLFSCCTQKGLPAGQCDMIHSVSDAQCEAGLAQLGCTANGHGGSPGVGGSGVGVGGSNGIGQGGGSSSCDGKPTCQGPTKASVCTMEMGIPTTVAQNCGIFACAGGRCGSCKSSDDCQQIPVACTCGDGSTVHISADSTCTDGSGSMTWCAHPDILDSVCDGHGGLDTTKGYNYSGCNSAVDGM